MNSKVFQDNIWQRHTIGCDPALKPWLHDHGSLTQRIQQRCEKFSVQVLRQGNAHVPYDEAALLGLHPRQHAYVREVLLLADGKPVVFAHSVVVTQHLRSEWSAIGKLGNRSLGTMLFTHPLVQRLPLHFRKLRSQHLIHQRTNLASQLHDSLWARRSLFTLYDAPLLVTEVFLPASLSLGS